MHIIIMQPGLWKRRRKVCLGILGLAIAVGGGTPACTSGYRESATEPAKTAAHNPETPPAAPGAPEPAEPAETAGWKNYKSAQFGYALKYPKEATLIRPKPGEAGEDVLDVVQIRLVGPTQKENTEFYDGLSFELFIKKRKGKSLEAVVNQEIKSAQATGEIKENKRTVEIAGRKGYQFIASGLGTFTHVFVPLKDDTYAHFVYSYGGARAADYRSMADAILRSVRFSD